MKSLNDKILAGLQTQLSMAMAADNEARIKSLKADIGAIQRDVCLREEMGMNHIEANSYQIQERQLNRRIEVLENEISSSFQAGRVSMHMDVMAEVNKDATRWDAHIADRLAELK